MSAARTKTIANDSLFCESRGSMGDLEDDLTNDEAMAATHDQIERMLAEKGRELLRQMMQAHYDARAAHERRVEVAGADGVERTQVRTASRQPETLFGTVEVERQLYQEPGSEGWRHSTRRVRRERAAPNESMIRHSFLKERLINQVVHGI